MAVFFCFCVFFFWGVLAQRKFVAKLPSLLKSYLEKKRRHHRKGWKYFRSFEKFGSLLFSSLFLPMIFLDSICF